MKDKNEFPELTMVNGQPTVSAHDLYRFLEIKIPFELWVESWRGQFKEGEHYFQTSGEPTPPTNTLN
jgi:phage anti-repressor protein